MGLNPWNLLHSQYVGYHAFGLREKVDGKLDELLQEDIIEEVPEGPSGWISPLVVAWFISV